MGGLFEWLPEQLKTASPLFAVASVVALGVVWRIMLRIHQQDRKTIAELTRTIVSITRDGTRAMVANAKAMEKLRASMERKNGRGR